MVGREELIKQYDERLEQVGGVDCWLCVFVSLLVCLGGWVGMGGREELIKRYDERLEQVGGCDVGMSC
jgi:hypothetical protein